LSFLWWCREGGEQLVEAFVALGQPALGTTGGVQFPRLEGRENRPTDDQVVPPLPVKVTSSSTSVSGAAS
jgi:hypothetical protein